MIHENLSHLLAVDEWLQSSFILLEEGSGSRIRLKLWDRFLDLEILRKLQYKKRLESELLMGTFRFILKKVLKKTFSKNSNYLTLEYLKYHVK